MLHRARIDKTSTTTRTMHVQTDDIRMDAVALVILAQEDALGAVVGQTLGNTPVNKLGARESKLESAVQTYE
jgi:hypothetical protein